MRHRTRATRWLRAGSSRARATTKRGRPRIFRREAAMESISSCVQTVPSASATNHAVPTQGSVVGCREKWRRATLTPCRHFEGLTSRVHLPEPSENGVRTAARKHRAPWRRTGTGESPQAPAAPDPHRGLHSSAPGLLRRRAAAAIRRRRAGLRVGRLSAARLAVHPALARGLPRGRPLSRLLALRRDGFAVPGAARRDPLGGRAGSLVALPAASRAAVPAQLDPAGVALRAG